ncbi:MAG: alpha/beta hydrolase [Gammaproteobacteria bacterium]
MTAQQTAVNSVLRGVVKPFLAFTSFHPDKLHKRRPLVCGAASLLPVPATSGSTGFPQASSGPRVDALNNDPTANDRVLLYLHGGGYLACSPITHRNITMRLARYAGCRVLAINYRKAPHYPYPYALEDSPAGSRVAAGSGTSADRIMLAGDSAGGHLTLATLLAIRDRPASARSGCLFVTLDRFVLQR